MAVPRFRRYRSPLAEAPLPGQFVYVTVSAARSPQDLEEVRQQTWEQVWQAETWENVWTAPVTRFQAGIDVPGRHARYLKLETKGDKRRPLLLHRVTVLGER